MNAGPAGGTGKRQQDEAPGAALPVIAVFGGADDEPTLLAAEQIGSEIGMNRAILLTGGDDPKADDLKGRVLAGACLARRGSAMAPWIGVVRKDRALAPRFAADGLSLVLTPGGGHCRNYAEAEFCDAAIAFAGEEGTSSEVLFCLALGKPLVLIGDPWLSQFPIVSGDDAQKALKNKALLRVPLRPTHPCLGPPITKAYGWFDQVVEPSFNYFELPPKTPPSTVLEAVIGAAEASGNPVHTACLSREHESIRQFRASLRSRQ